MSVWPWSDVVSTVMRFAQPPEADPERFRVVELGCGAGANIPFFLALGVDYHGIDGSRTIVSSVNARFPMLEGKVVVGDFTKEIPFLGKFDLIFDRGSMTHNSSDAIRRCIRLIRGSLRRSGTFVGIDWFSTEHSDFEKGRRAEDEHTRTGYETGQFAGLGRVHFADEAEILELFSAFEIVSLQHKLVTSSVPDDQSRLATWSVVARPMADEEEVGVSQ